MDAQENELSNFLAVGQTGGSIMFWDITICDTWSLSGRRKNRVKSKVKTQNMMTCNKTTDLNSHQIQ